MNLKHLPFDSALQAYQLQADELLTTWQSGEASAVELVRHNHPRFLSETVSWLPKPMTEAELRGAPFQPEDARLALARWYAFQNWERLAEYVAAVRESGSPVARFEAAVEAVINGDEAALAAFLGEDPALVGARSTRVTYFDPPEHRATLLHYVGANGVEGYRQRTPPNAVTIATLLLRSGAEADALAYLYGGGHTTMSMLVSSVHPAEAGVQVALVETLLDFGANVDGAGSGEWVSPLKTALAFGYINAAEALVRRGARVDALPEAAGLGRLDLAEKLLPEASALDRHRALALAAQMGHTGVVRLLLDAGEDPNRFNPEGNHGHSTPLHQAALAGRESVVRLLVERGARLDIKDKIWHGTPTGWAEHAGNSGIAAYLRSQGH